MPQPIWRKVVERAPVPESSGTPWTKVLDYVTPGKTMKIEVVIDDKEKPCKCTGKWKPANFAQDIGPDGDFDGSASKGGSQLVTTAPLGALIARIGGSTADQAPDPPTTTPATRLFFSVGRHCVFVAPQAPVGALYLAVNDAAANMGKVTGNLCVDVFEAL